MELADEHRRITNLVARIESAQGEEELPELLASLHDVLVDHFAHEQFPGGLYECMGANNAEHHDTLKVLVREHCELLSGARALVEHARASETAPGISLHQEVERLLARLRRHEVREHDLARSIELAGLLAG
jgi:hypothetical protein